jgi:hypothetical protein
MNEPIELIYTNGDSWTAGIGMDTAELFNYSPSKSWDLIKKFRWTEKLAEKLSCNYINEALGAGSNKRMVRKTCDFILRRPPESYKNLLVVLGWTTIDRDEVYIEHDDFHHWCRFNANQSFSEQLTYGKFDIEDKQFVKNIDKLQKKQIELTYNLSANLAIYYQQLFLMSQMLESYGIRYIFFNSITIMENPDTIPAFERYRKILESPKFYKMKENYAWSEHCVINNLPMSECKHPLLEAHANWAELMYNHTNKLYLTP